MGFLLNRIRSSGRTSAVPYNVLFRRQVLRAVSFGLRESLQDRCAHVAYH